MKLFVTGFVYGAKENKRLQLFIDDLNLPKPDEHGVQRCNEVIYMTECTKISASSLFSIYLLKYDNIFNNL